MFFVIALLALIIIIASPVYASETESVSHVGFAQTFLWIGIILLLAKASNLVERWGQPAVLGELIMGVILGNLVLIGFDYLEPIKSDSIITFMAELGVVLLLFQIGLGSNIGEMKKVGNRALIVAIVGVVIPFILGTYIVGPWLLPGLSNNAYLFLGASLTATSVGITARVFKDLGELQTKEARIILGAAVIDDVLGLIILAVVSAIVTVGSISLGGISWIIGKSLLFLVGSIVIGHYSAPHIGKLFSKINTGFGMKFALAISFGLILSFGAGAIGLAPIVGAFAAGLVLDSVHFKFFKDPQIVADLSELRETVDTKSKDKITEIINHHSQHHIEDFIEHLGHFFIPIFFILTGMSVDLSVLVQGSIIKIALAITAVAFIGKLVSGLVAGNDVNRWLVGWGMSPRGEVGLIFASIGLGLGVITDEIFSIIVAMVILTTLITPIILGKMLKKS